MITRVIVFGALGDLMRRYLAPALVDLHAARAVPEELSVTGAGRDDLTDDEYRGTIADALDRHVPDADPHATERLLRRLRYVRADATEAGDVSRATEPERGPFLAYLALPPHVFGAAAAALAEAGFPDGSQLVVEKPFGHDRDSARTLNEEIHRRIPESRVFRIDHFLGMQTVQNVLGLRFGNRLLEPLWNCHHVKRVEIVWDETLTVEGRAFYDDVGAVRDVIQNHLLQLLCLVGMEPPASLAPRELRDRKVQLLRDVRPPDRTAAERAVRGRYTAGTVGGRAVPGYTEDSRVDAARATETFAEIELRIDNWRWSEVPIVLRTGKALARDRKEVLVTFRPVPHGTFTAAPDLPNVLRLELEPERLALAVNVNAPGERYELERIELDRDLATGPLGAYARVLLAALHGDPTLSIRDDEVEASWEIVDPLLGAWADGAAPLREYPAGSAGPERA
ncbi:MAG TPA: glucose-6-phosphate dehydrogenase [Egibacteraceae bacterium]|jgi:glucose-6-phosphate 1-dehydrogenase|nr:glucose-6-phosphate dehydrogenase [Egibacteraceae bacterium]